MRHIRTALLIGVLAIVTMVPSVAAQGEATPVSLGADRCTVDLIDAETYNAAIMASVPPLPANPYPQGTPADDATVAAVTDIIEQSVACTNVGDLGRLLALLDPAYAPTLLGVPFEDVPSAVEAAIAASQTPDPATPLVDDIDQGGLVSTILDISNVQVLEDGRVTAETTVQRVDFPPSTFTVYLRMDDALGRYVITNYAFHYAPGEVNDLAD